MATKPASQKSARQRKPRTTLAYHVLMSYVEEALTAIKSDRVKALPKKDVMILQQTAAALLCQLDICLKDKA